MTKFFAFILVAAVIIAVASSVIYAGGGKKNQANSNQANLWEKVDESKIQVQRGERATIPEKYLVFRLNRTLLKDSLANLPLEGDAATREKAVIMDVPLPDGSIQRFRMEETTVLSPELAADFPDWKTFVGYGIDDPTATGRFDWNVLGFHGYVSTEKGTALIDPYQKGDTANYLVYYQHDYGKSGNEFYCRIEQKMTKITESDYKPDFLPSAPEFSLGGSVRTYRFAVATTGEWTRNAGNYPTVTDPVQLRTNALAVVVTAVNRLNGIYLRELGSQFQLVNPSVSDEAKNIIFDNPATDPYDNTDNTTNDPAATPPKVDQNAVNQTTIDNRVGAANYDIGHEFGTSGGGVASSPSLCTSVKAEGYSARGTDTGDPFTVDYVAHEIGHQFGASHTYNNSDPGGACTTRSAGDAFEVASGATIMSYVGICSQRNLQQYVDTGFPSFHIRSLTQMNTNVTTGAPSAPGCGSASGTNAVPTVNAGASYTIPKLTPFALTATAGDADGGDVANLLYSWEEYDPAPSASGALGTPAGTYDVDDASSGNRLLPLFRPYSPVSGSKRTFPSLTFILNPASNDPAGSNQPKLEYTGVHPTGFPGAVCDPNSVNPCVVGERLPTVNRTMNFRVSVRDRRGGVADAGTTVTVAGGAGPFQITTQNSSPATAPSVTWQAGTSQTVTWDVASTDVAPVSATNVNILLSTDGGQTFPITLKANTLNDGTEPITVPNNPTQTARIKVEAVGNVFFDINNANFAITAPTAASVSVSGRVVSTGGRGVSNARVTLTDQNGAARSARTNSFGYYRFDELAAGQTYIFNVSHKRYVFSTRVVSVSEDLGRFDFLAEN